MSDGRFKKGNKGGLGRPATTYGASKRLSKAQVEIIVARWSKDPRTMLEDRSKIILEMMVRMREVMRNPRKGRGEDLAAIRATQALYPIILGLEGLRRALPVVCPKCDNKFSIA